MSQSATIWVKSRRTARRWSGCGDRTVGLPGKKTTLPYLPLKGRYPMNLFVLRTWLEAKFAKDERGASMVEYILLVALIALAVIAAVVFLKDQVNGKFNDAGSKLSSSGS
jgi:Flp pilus assembly pilin Flp